MNNLHRLVVPERPTHSFERKTQGRVIAMSSTVPAEHISEAQQRLTGDSFIRSHLRKLSPCQSILPFEVLTAQLGRNPEDIVKLDANENPYGPPPGVAEALGCLKIPHIYPDPASRQLHEALAKDSGLGSDEDVAQMSSLI